jgi:hypothetical protein
MERIEMTTSTSLLDASSWNEVVCCGATIRRALLRDA